MKSAIIYAKTATNSSIAALLMAALFVHLLAPLSCFASCQAESFPIYVIPAGPFRCDGADLVFPHPNGDPNHQWSFARSILSSSITPDTANRLPRALNLFAADHLQEAIAAVDSALRLSSHSHLYIFRAHLNYSLNNCADALMDLDHAMGESLDTCDKISICHLLIALKSFSKIDSLMQQIRSDDVNYYKSQDFTPHYLFLKGELELARGQYSEALASLLETEMRCLAIGDEHGAMSVRKIIEKNQTRFASWSCGRLPVPKKGKECLLFCIKSMQQQGFPLSQESLSTIFGYQIKCIDDCFGDTTAVERGFSRGTFIRNIPSVKLASLNRFRQGPSGGVTWFKLIIDPVVCSLSMDELSELFSKESKVRRLQESVEVEIPGPVGKKVTATFNANGFKSLTELKVLEDLKSPPTYSIGCGGQFLFAPDWRSPTEILTDAQAKLRKHPLSPSGWSEKIESLLMLKRFSEAQATFKEWRRIDKSETKLSLTAEYKVAEACSNYLVAAGKLAQLIRSYNSDKTDKIHLVELLVKGEHFSEALDWLADLDLSDPEVQLLRAKALIGKNAEPPEEARTLLKSAAIRFENDAKIGKRDEALKLLVTTKKADDSCSDSAILLLRKQSS